MLPPDALTYLAQACGHPVPRPFAWRRLWPMVLVAFGVRDDGAEARIPGWLVRWWPMFVLGCGAVVVACLGWRAGALVIALPMARQWSRWPFMPDAPVFALACMATVAPPWLAVLLAVVAGGLHERAPVFAALWAWSPWPLVGLALPGLLALGRVGVGAGRPDEAWVVERPFRSAWLAAQAAPAWVYVLPWAGCLAALAAPVPWPVWVCIAVAYGQCCVATDRARLYQWAAPAVAPLAVAVLGDWWWVAALVTLAVPAEWSAVAGSPWPIRLARGEA